LTWSERITHEDEEGFKHVEEVTRIGFVSGFEGLSEDLNHKGKKALKGFLKFRSEKIPEAVLFGLTMSALSSMSIYWAIVPRHLATSV
jgi:hypothetical protein